MLLSVDMVEFPSSSAAGSATFFAAAFGWQAAISDDDYTDVISGGPAFGFRSEADAPATPRVLLRTNNLTATRAAVEQAGGVITAEPFSFPGGRRFHFREPGGCEFAVWSPM